METTQIKDQIQSHVDRLSTERLRVALDFLSYLSQREDDEMTADEATEELLSIPNFRQELEEAKKQAAAGEVVDWRMVRDDM